MRMQINSSAIVKAYAYKKCALYTLPIPVMAVLKIGTTYSYLFFKGSGLVVILITNIRGLDHCRQVICSNDIKGCRNYTITTPKWIPKY